MKLVKIELFPVETRSCLRIPYAGTRISAGFPSPADDYMEGVIDLNRELVKNPASTFYARVTGLSMIEAGISNGDILIVDKSLTPANGKIAVCFVDGEFTLKRISITTEGMYLLPANASFKPIRITEENNFTVWGVVTYVIKKVW